MAYTFNTEKVASLNFVAQQGYSGKTIPGINGIASADDIYKGTTGLFFIAGTESNYNFEDAIRNLKQSVSGTKPPPPPT